MLWGTELASELEPSELSVPLDSVLLIVILVSWDIPPSDPASESELVSPAG